MQQRLLAVLRDDGRVEWKHHFARIANQLAADPGAFEDGLAARIAELQPELILGTQMERHIAKRLGIPCTVISAPMHVQDFPARHSPQMGHEGANVLFDTLVHPLMMGLEEHLLGMFREDPEFHDGVAPSHLGGRPAATPESTGMCRPVVRLSSGPVSTYTASAMFSGTTSRLRIVRLA